MKTKKAGPKDIQKVFQILQASNRKLIKEGMNHWRGFYKKDKIKQNISKKETYLIIDQERIIGTLNLSKKEPLIYKDKITHFNEKPKGKIIYLSALSILPSLQQKGFGKKSMELAEMESKKEGYKFMVLDVISSYKKLNKFYINLGYKKIGKIMGSKATGNIYSKRL